LRTRPIQCHVPGIHTAKIGLNYRFDTAARVETGGDEEARAYWSRKSSFSIHSSAIEPNGARGFNSILGFYERARLAATWSIRFGNWR